MPGTKPLTIAAPLAAPLARPPLAAPSPRALPVAVPDQAPDALGLALRRAAREGRGLVVLRVEEAAPHRRKVARALLQEGALAAGGQVLDGPGGDLLLVGAEPGRAARLRALVERLVGPAATQLLCLRRDAAALASYATGGAPPAPRPSGEAPGLAGLDAFLDALPLARAVRRAQGFAPHDAARPVFLRLEPDRARLAAALGPLGEDADIMDHAVRRLAARLVGALADAAEARALLGPAPPPCLHLPLPAGFQPDAASPPAPPGMLVATLPLAEAAEPEALARRQAALAAAGIGLEIEGLDAAGLALVEAAALPAGLIRLRWSPALAEPWARAALARIGTTRLVLDGADAAAAQRLGAGLVEAEAP
jgi:hypothetical protein